MKRLAIEDLARKIDILIKVAPKEKILLTLKGQPFAFVYDATNYDWEDIGYMVDPEFWKMIAERRKEKATISLEDLKAELEKEEKAEKQAARRNGRNGSKKPQAKRNRSAA